jgi:hypothetical protein
LPLVGINNEEESKTEIKNAPCIQEAFLITAVGWAAVSAGPLQERRSRLAQMILPNKIR